MLLRNAGRLLSFLKQTSIPVFIPPIYHFRRRELSSSVLARVERMHVAGRGQFRLPVRCTNRLGE